VVFEGDDSQTIPESAFVNNTVASVIVNNLFGVITESDLIITNTLNLASPNPSDNKGGMDTGLKLLYSDATIIGQGDVTGIVSRSSIVANKTYTLIIVIQQLSLRTQELYLPQLVSNCRLNFTYLEIKWG
jgi:hypothetical protein